MRNTQDCNFGQRAPVCRGDNSRASDSAKKQATRVALRHDIILSQSVLRQYDTALDTVSYGSEHSLAVSYRV